MPSKQDIAIAKGLAKEAGKMVAEELAKMLVPGIGWFTGMVSIVKLVKALNDPGDESRHTEILLMVPQDARFAVYSYYKDARGYLLDFYDVNKQQEDKRHAKYRQVGWANRETTIGKLVRFGKKHNKSSDYTNTETQSNKGGGSRTSVSSVRVGFHRKRYKNPVLINVNYQTLVDAAIIENPALAQYENEMLAGAVITQAAFKVADKSNLFNNDAKPLFNENNPQPLIEYGEALAEYVQLVNTLGMLPAGVATFGDPLIYRPVLGTIAGEIATAFGLDLNSNYVTFKGKGKKGETVRDIYVSELEGARKQVPNTSAIVDVSMPGSPLDKPAATPPAATLPEAVYTIDRPNQNFLAGPSIVAIREDGSVVTSRYFRPNQNTLAPSKAEQQLGKLGLVENVSTASEPRTEPAGATDRSVLVLLAAAAAALALL
jgi:hypothetical protein